MIDVTGQIDAVRRRVDRRAVEGADVHVLVLEQDLPVPAAVLWAALTSPKRLPRWFLPVSGDLRVGGRFQLEGNAGGTIETCEPGASFSATWEFGDTVGRIVVTVAGAGRAGPGDAAGAGDSDAAEDGASADRSRLVLEHHGDADDASWAAYGPGAAGVGWDLSLLGLALYLAPGGAEDPDAWDGGEDGRWFVELAGEAWHAADVAGGADSVEARARANRTIAAYTEPGGEDED